MRCTIDVFTGADGVKQVCKLGRGGNNRQLRSKTHETTIFMLSTNLAKFFSINLTRLKSKEAISPLPGMAREGNDGVIGDD